MTLKRTRAGTFENVLKTIMHVKTWLMLPSHFYMPGASSRSVFCMCVRLTTMSLRRKSRRVNFHRYFELIIKFLLYKQAYQTTLCKWERKREGWGKRDDE